MIPEGELSEVLCGVDDETQIRKAVQNVLKAVIQSGLAKRHDAFMYERTERHTDFEEFAMRISAADASRHESIRKNRSVLAEDFQCLSSPYASP